MSETAPPAIGLFDAIHTARAQRRLRPDPVPDALITQVLDAAIRAPSAGNAQNWDFVVIRDAERRREVGALYRKGSDIAAAVYAARSRPISTRRRARCDSSASLARKARVSSVWREASSGQASARHRARAKRTGRVASGTAVPACRTTLRQESMMKSCEARSAATSARSSERRMPPLMNCAAGASRICAAASTSA
ncbi:MAG: nitroreductase family protein, partial [Rhodospirillales bacterium]|nr:nitroreductase family protein [Rhodospirillales bacterium]